MQCPFGTWPCATIWDSQLQTRSYHHIKQNISKVFTLSIYLSVDNDIYYSLQQRNLKVMSFEVPGYHIYSVNVSSFLLTYLSLPFSLCLLLNHQSQIHTFFLILCFFPEIIWWVVMQKHTGYRHSQKGRFIPCYLFSELQSCFNNFKNRQAT